MIDRYNLDIFCMIVLKYAVILREDYKDRFVGCTFKSGAKLELNDETFKLTTKDGISHEFGYSDSLSVALEAQCENVFITVYDCIKDNIYKNVFNIMIYERYP